MPDTPFENPSAGSIQRECAVLKFSGGLLTALLTAVVILAQVNGKPTNDDRDGMRMSNLDSATKQYAHAQAHAATVSNPKPRADSTANVLVWTRGYDNARSYANLQESVLTPTNVGGLKKLYSHVMPGDARGIEAAPLIIPGVKLASGETYDLVLYATMDNDLYAFDADSPRLLWAKNYGRSILGSGQIDGWLINTHWGVLSTPVYDADSGTVYFVTWTSSDSTWQKGVFTLRGARVTDGAQTLAASLEGVTYAPDQGLPLQRFSGSQRKQRASLALATVDGRKTVFIPSGTIFESSSGNRGWMIAYDVPSKLFTAWTSSSRYSGGGIWEAGNAPAVRTNADGSADLWFVTGNGAFDAITEWGECFLKLHYKPPVSAAFPGSFEVASWWSPFSDSGRAGGPATGTHITKDNGGGWDDMDLMTLTYLPEYNLVIGASKDGIGYVLDADNMGNTKPEDFVNPAANYAKAKWIGWLTYPSAMDLAQYGPPPSPTPNDFTKLNFLYPGGLRNKNNGQIGAGLTHHEHAPLVWWKDQLGDYKLYAWGENGNLRCFHVGKDGKLTFLANGAEQASVQSQRPPGGMPGGMMSLSANGTQNAVLWALVPLGDANKEVTPGFLAAYDANNLGKYSDGTGAIRLLWQAQVLAHPKFNVPVVSGGKLFVPTYAGGVDVYGLQ